MKHSKSSCLTTGLVLSLATLLSSSALAQYVYVGEYGGAVHRFDLNGNPAPAGTFFNGYTSISLVEGINGYGQNNLILAANVNGRYGIHQFNRHTGTYIGRNASLPSTAFDIVVSPDQSTIYAATGNVLYAVNVNSGTIVNSLTHNRQGWGVAIHPITGQIYYSGGWTSNNAASRGVYKTSSTLSGSTGVITVGQGNLNGLSAPAGITFLPNGDLFVINGGNGDPTNAFVNRYSYNAQNDSYTWLEKLDSPDPNDPGFRNGFDLEFGPDGHLYATNEDGACVVRFEINNGNFYSVFIHANAGGLPAAKTIHFDANSPGYEPVPEPGHLAFCAVGAATAGLFLRFRRRG